MKNKILALIICRLNSKRLPKKMIKKINNKKTIDIIISRIKKVKMIDNIILLTSNNPIDKKFVEIAKNHKIKILRGSEHNVLNRINSAIRKIDYTYKYIVRVNGDCPLLMPSIIDNDIKNFIKSNSDLYSPFYKNKKPFGFSFVIFKKRILFKIERLAKKKKYKEHIENFCFDNKKKFKILTDKINKNSRYYCPNLKLVLDTEKDLKRIRFLFKKLKNIPINKQPYEAIKIFKKKNA